MRLFRFEHRADPLLPRRQFLARLMRHITFAAGIVALSLGIGVVGYHAFESLSWIDALLNASMILGGMGPVDPIHTTAGKLFASFYSLFSGILFLVVVGIIVAPLAHRLMHRMHMEEQQQGDQDEE
jgi:hypothetical protein